ncbi:hypothetical protein [Streptomyces sp. NPDC047841]
MELAAVDGVRSVFDGDDPAERLGGGDLHLRNAALRLPLWRSRPASSRTT